VFDRKLGGRSEYMIGYNVTFRFSRTEWIQCREDGTVEIKLQYRQVDVTVTLFLRYRLDASLEKQQLQYRQHFQYY